MSRFKLLSSPVDARDYTADMVGIEKTELTEQYEPAKRQSVKFQGISSCCVAYAICTAIAYCEAKHGVKPNDGSRGFIYLNRNGEDEDVSGMYTRKALKILQKEGTCQYHEYRWSHNTHGALMMVGEGKEEKLEPLAAPYKIQSYFSLKTIEEVKRTVCTLGACICRYSVRSPFENVLHIPEEGEKRGGGHAVACIGWNKDGFILQDSYTKFAHATSEVGAGCFLMPYSYFEKFIGTEVEFWGLIPNFDAPRKPPKFINKVGNFLYPIATPFVEAWYWIKTGCKKLCQKLGNI